MCISYNAVHEVIKDFKTVSYSLLRSSYVDRIKNLRISPASELLKYFLLNAKPVHCSSELGSKVMEGHLHSVLLQQSIITSLDIPVFLVNDKVSISLMRYLLNEIVDIVRKRNISCGKFSLVPVFNDTFLEE